MALRIAAFDFIDVTVNSDFPLGKNSFKTLTFDARFQRVSPDELEEFSRANTLQERGVLLKMVRDKLISTIGLKDFQGNACDVPELTGDNADERAKALEDFMATHPLPIDAAYAFAKNQSKRKN